jgi:hypothetical protein
MPVAEQLDPVALSLISAPVDDEPETEEELHAIEETREALRAGKPLMPLDEFERLVADRVAAGK